MIAAFCDRALDRLCRAFAWLALPLTLLLFAQWPLRELLATGSREANDVAQIVFALYAAVAVTAATRAGAHLGTDVQLSHRAPRTRARLARVAALGVMAPWSAYVLWIATPLVVHAVAQLESFPETFNPGYFVLKLALPLFALLILLQSLRDGLAPVATDR